MKVQISELIKQLLERYNVPIDKVEALITKEQDLVFIEIRAPIKSFDVSNIYFGLDQIFNPNKESRKFRFTVKSTLS